MTPITVYVLSIGTYEQRGVAGVFSTLEAAQAHMGGLAWVEIDDTTWDAVDCPDGADIQAIVLDPPKESVGADMDALLATGIPDARLMQAPHGLPAQGVKLQKA